jgi:nucleoside-diphosphate-sugar epimerase
MDTPADIFNGYRQRPDLRPRNRIIDAANGSAPLHVDAAAHAALLAIEGAKPEIFNIAEDTGYVSIAKARRELGWDPDFRLRNRETNDVLSATTHRSQRV